MNTNIFKNIGIVIGIILIAFVAYKFYPVSNTSNNLQGTTNLDALSLDTTLTVGTTSTFDGPSTYSSVLSTTTGASMTLAQSDLGYATILMNPVVGAISITLPATSTLTTFIPNAGDTTRVVIANATSTAAATITIVTGTGIRLSKATTTPAIAAGSAGVIDFIRKTNGDIIALLTLGI